ncbi:MAG: hypothetical protein MHM6MM_003975 [Cercozoa sp. M6MM]
MASMRPHLLVAPGFLPEAYPEFERDERRQSLLKFETLPTELQVREFDADREASRPGKRETGLSWRQIRRLLKQFMPPRVDSEERKKKEERLLKLAWSMRSVVIVGIHGWQFVGGLLSRRPPSDTSEKLVKAADEALKRYLSDFGVDKMGVDTTLVVADSRGTVEDRVKRLRSRLASSTPVLSAASAVIFVCHSQGALVGARLLELLIRDGILHTQSQRVGYAALAAPHLGPFRDLPGDMYSATRELFSLADCASEAAQQHAGSLSFLLETGVRVLSVASFKDQVVPLHSALMHTHASHPHLLRALYVDSRHVSPLLNTGRNAPLLHFLTYLLRLRNETTEFPDLLPHLSATFRGSLLERPQVHSTVYDADDVFDLCIRWLLQPTDLREAAPVVLSSVALLATALKEPLGSNNSAQLFFLRRRSEQLFRSTLTHALTPRAQLREFASKVAQWHPHGVYRTVKAASEAGLRAALSLPEGSAESDAGSEDAASAVESDEARDKLLVDAEHLRQRRAAL